MLSFFSRYKYTQKSNLYDSNLYDINLQKYIRKIEADLREKNNILVKPLKTDIILHNPMYTGYPNYNLLPIVAFICFLAGYNLSNM
jgi:hypothetical protein